MAFSFRWKHGEPAVVESWEPDQGMDQYGDPVAGFAAPYTIDKCVLAPGQSVLDTGGHTVRKVETTPTLYTPPGVRIAARSRITVRNMVFEAVSDSKVWASPYSGIEAGSVTELKAVS